MPALLTINPELDIALGIIDDIEAGVTYAAKAALYTFPWQEPVHAEYLQDLAIRVNQTLAAIGGIRIIQEDEGGCRGIVLESWHRSEKDGQSHMWLLSPRRLGRVAIFTHAALREDLLMERQRRISTADLPTGFYL